MPAEITIPLANQVLIDWFAFTLTEFKDPHEAIKKTGLSKLAFTESGGGMGYKKSLRSSNIVVFFDGNDGMGCHISMTGQGCRQYEGCYPSPNRWFMLFILLIELKANITRIDIAIDNIDGQLNLKRSIQYYPLTCFNK